MNIYRPSLPQAVTVQFIRGQTPDEHPDLSHLQQSYSDIEDDAERERCQKEDEARLAAYHCGEWHMRGLWVEARVLVPTGNGSFSIYALRSPGLWGVESDCSVEDESAIWRDEETNLRAALKAMAPAFAALELPS